MWKMDWRVQREEIRVERKQLQQIRLKMIRVGLKYGKRKTEVRRV